MGPAPAGARTVAYPAKKREICTFAAQDHNPYIAGENYVRKHILLEKMFVYDIPSITAEIIGYEYRPEDGFWVNKTTQMPLMFDDIDFKPRTKKEDIETGEDRKGE